MSVPEAAAYRNALELESMLLEYRLESVLGAGGFGMTYLGWDTHLEKHVAIKEYLPAALAIRALDGSIVPVSTDSEHNYTWGLERFIQEARTLAQFSHPNIVRVNRFFEANNTSYMVMDYEAGESLHQQLRRLPQPDEAALKNIVMPILDGLQAVHQLGFLHRDIKPSNVFIRANGIPLLLDFGSARMASVSAAKSMTAIVTPGYAPLEQYTSDGNQGPWSDIYALSGVVYRAVTGENPPDALSRMKADTVPQLLAAAHTRYSERFLKVIEWGMTIDETMRPQSIADWRDLFLGRMAITASSRGFTAASPSRVALTQALPTARATFPASEAAKKGSMLRASGVQDQPVGRGKWWVAGAAALIMLVLLVLMSERKPVSQTAPTQPVPQDRSAPPRPTAPAASAQPHLPAASAEVQPPAASQPPVARSAPAAAGAAPELAPDAKRAVNEELRAADVDGDGYLSQDEVKGRFPFIAQNFSIVDTDRDGRISPDELWQLRRKQRNMKTRP